MYFLEAANKKVIIIFARVLSSVLGRRFHVDDDSPPLVNDAFFFLVVDR